MVNVACGNDCKISCRNTIILTGDCTPFTLKIIMTYI